jgi:tyrosine-specific transport protein
MKIKKWGSELEAFFTIVGTVIGLGILAIPFAAKQVGVWPTTLLIIWVAFIMVVINILFAEIIIFDKRKECIIAYAGRYLGDWARRIETFSIFFGYTGSILAYVLAMAVFIQAIIPGDINYFWPIILAYSGVTCIVLINGVKSLGRMEILLTGLMCAAFVVVFLASGNHWGSVNDNWSRWILPYGVIWFALTGESAIPIAVTILGKERKKIIKIILSAYGVIAIITILFFMGALWTGGASVGPDPFVAMAQKMGGWVKYAGSLIGILAVVTSHWVLSTYLKKILVSDIKLTPLVGWFLAVFTPLVLILLGASNFVHIIGLVGVVAGTTDALILLTIYKKIFSRENTKPRVLPFKMPRSVLWILFFLLLGAAISSITLSL